MLRFLLHAPRGPFYSPKVARSRWMPTWKAKLAFCWVVHRTVTVRTVTVAVRCAIAFQIRRIRPLVHGVSWRTGHCPMHTGQSGVSNRPLARAHVTRTCRLFAFPEGDEFAADDSPDSPVIFSRTLSSSHESGEFTRTSLAHRTLSGAPPDSPVCQAELEFAAHSQLFFQLFSHCF
jgi:hypothetical protein